ncbi:hypothetical protein Unana1_06346 [Umbelopsis nana]
MSGRGRIPQAFLAKLEEKKRKAREDPPEDFTDDFVPLDAPDTPVEYAAKVMGNTVLPIGGIEVQFPFKPYPAQIQMMSKVIEAVSRSQDALIESPTGSGKSLALLCASLAWQKHDQMSRANSIANIHVLSDGEDDDIQILSKEEAKKVWTDETLSVEVESATQQEFQPLRPTRIQRKRQRYIEKLDPRIKESEPEPKVEPLMQSKASTLVPKATRIYYASRTHKQISQVVAELKNKTPYRPKMTILGSRDQLCIHPKVSRAANKNEECSALLDESRCSYGTSVRKLVGHSSVQRSGSNFIWDIEDLTNVGRKTHACPYFASKQLLEGAEIVFCPYNYLIEPLIREAYDIDLKDCVVIIDEAHNIEDAAREAASFAIHEKELKGLQTELSLLIKYEVLVEQHKKLLYVVESLMNWIVDPNNVFSPLEYEHYINSWTGPQLVNKLSGLGINRLTMANDLMPALAQVISAVSQIRKEKASQTELEQLMVIGYEDEEFSSEAQTKGSRRKKCLGAKQLTLLQGLFVVFGNLFQVQGDNAADYVMVLMKRAHRQRMAFNKDSDWEFKLFFWCHNAGIAFKDITASARTVILSSGTLSPLNTFASELHTDFPIRLETNHVIDKSQVWAGVIPSGPDNVDLIGSFKTINTYVYQDDIGNALLRIAQIVPNGILCFVPSYSTLNKFMARWQRTGLLTKLSEAKLIITEPQNVTKAAFEKELARFYNSVSTITGNQNGAIFIAVYRGKVSEGIDFSDARCRAVISIGIPYPNLKDFSVISKRDYNSHARKLGKNILSGDEWYIVQAHRGAIILLENRFLQAENVNALSKWIRARCKRHRNGFEDAMKELTDFVKTRTQLDDVEMEEYLAQSERNDQPMYISEATSRVKEKAVNVSGSVYGAVEQDAHASTSSIKVIEQVVHASSSVYTVIEQDSHNPSSTSKATGETVNVSSSLSAVGEQVAYASDKTTVVNTQSSTHIDLESHLDVAQLNAHNNNDISAYADIMDAIEDISDYEPSGLLDERPLSQHVNANQTEETTGMSLRQIYYNITCRQCKMELGYCKEDDKFVVQQKCVSNQYFKEIRQPHLPDSACYVYELLPHQDWSSSIFRVDQSTTMTVQWNPHDRICYQELHCPTCQNSVPNGLGSSIIGARIAVCQSGSSTEITELLGRVWLLQEAVKIGKNVEQRPDSSAKEVDIPQTTSRR